MYLNYISILDVITSKNIYIIFLRIHCLFDERRVKGSDREIC